MAARADFQIDLQATLGGCTIEGSEGTLELPVLIVRFLGFTRRKRCGGRKAGNDDQTRGCRCAGEDCKRYPLCLLHRLGS